MDTFPLRRGHLLLVAFMRERGWTQYRLAKNLGCLFSVSARVLRRERGVGADLAARIETATDGAVPAASWVENAAAEDLATYDAALAEIVARGAARTGLFGRPVKDAP